VNLKIENVVRCARGSALFVGIPIEGIGTIVLLRRHLRAALEIQPVPITYNRDTKVVSFRNHRAEWRLNDLLGQGKIQQWQLRAELHAWANSKRSAARKRKETAALGKAGVYVRRLREAIAKLTRQRDKIYLRAPVSPLLPERRDGSDYGREQTLRWIAEKPIRKTLAKLTGQKLIHGEPKTWADFYRAVEAITGRSVSESQTFARVHGRKRYRHSLPNYPDREDYLKNLPRYLCLAERPWDWRSYDPSKKEEYGEQLNALERHARARQEYCAALRERKAIESQIEAHRAEIASVIEGAETV
jgi:hypothetical protein